MKISLRQLAVFDALVTHGSVTRAAEVMCMSQSAASASLHDFQMALDRPPLFKRDGRRLRTTAEGMKVHLLARSILSDAKEIERPSEKAEIAGTVNVGMTPEGSYMLPRLSADFKRKHPNVRINFTVGHARDIIERLSSLELETIVLDSIVRAPGAHLSEFFEESWILIAGPNHWLVELSRPTFQDLARAEWCIPERLSTANLRLMEGLKGHIPNLQVALEINSYEGIREAVKAGMGIGCLPESMAQTDLKLGSLVKISVDGFKVVRSTFLVWLLDLKRSRAAKAFDDFMLETGKMIRQKRT